MVQAELTGLLPPSFSGQTAPALIYGGPTAPEYREKYVVEVDDARVLQTADQSEADFFAKHGFVLLRHRTAVRDWDQDIVAVYHPEIAAIVSDRLFPGRRVEVAQSARVLRRGRGRRFYASFVHADGALSPDLYAANLGLVGPEQNARWFRSKYARDDVAGMVSISLWRTTNMRGPLRHLPLAMCDPKSVEPSDIFPSTIVGVAPGGSPTNHAALRFNAGQRWFYYPNVTGAELIAFKLCEFWKDKANTSPEMVFHTSFRDPTAPADAEERQSCDHRVSVFILRS